MLHLSVLADDQSQLLPGLPGEQPLPELVREQLVRRIVGIDEADDLLVELDGEDLHWVPRENIGTDRWHYDIKINETLSEGEHELKFTLKNQEREPEAQLCSIEILEFGDESE